MPAGDVTATIIFEKRIFNLEIDPPIRDTGDTSSAIAVSNLTPSTGERIIVTVTPQIGHELVSLKYFLPGSDEGIDIDKYGLNYAFTIVSGVQNGQTVHIVASFGLINHKFSVEPSSLDGGTFTFYIGSKQVTSAGFNDLIRVYLTEKSSKGYKYKDNSFKVITLNNNPVPLVSAVKNGAVAGGYIFTFYMPNSSVIISAEYDMYKYNLSPAVVSNGAVNSISKTSNVPLNTYVTFKAMPAEGYTISSKDFSLKSGSTTVKSSGFAPTGNPNEYGFTLDFSGALPSDGSTIQIVAQFSVDYFPLSRDPNTTGLNISFSHATPVLYNSNVTITIARSSLYRYIPGSVKMNGGVDNGLLTQEVMNPSGAYTMTFRMPARPVVVSASYEPIPIAVIDVNDPNMDKYIHFLDPATSAELTSVSPGSTVTVEAYVPTYPGAPPNEIMVKPLIVQSWWLDNNKVLNGPAPVYTLPDPCFVQTVTAIVTIDGIPHSVSIPVRYN